MFIKPGSNLNLSLGKMGASMSTGLNNWYGSWNGRISIGDTFRNVSRTGTGAPKHGVFANSGGANRLSSYYGASNISFSSLFNGDGFDTVDGIAAYFRSAFVDAGQWRNNIDNAPYYTSNSSANGAIIAGTNGDLNGSFIGYGPGMESYYMWGGNSKHWRIGVNIYRLSADGSEFQRVFTHHHIADSIGDQSSVSLGLGAFSPGTVKHGGVIYRLQDNGNPTLGIGAYNITNNTFNGNGWMPRIALNGVNQWGQPLDAIDIGPSDDSAMRIGAFLWQRQWWGNRVVFFKHNGSSVINQSMQSLQKWYQDWIVDHNFGGQGGLAYSPVSGKMVCAFVYEPNGTTAGRNLALNSFNVYNVDSTNNAIVTDGLETDVIHFIWGGRDACKQDLGTYSAAHIAYLTSDEDNGDYFALIFINESQNRVIIRLMSVHWPSWRSGSNMCNWVVWGEAIYTGVNAWQRVRVTRVDINQINDRGAPSYEMVFAASYVNSSNQTVVKTFKFAEGAMAEWNTFTPHHRGLLAGNGTPANIDGANRGDFGRGRGQHVIVMGGTNDGVMTTYTWDGSKTGGSLSRSGDQDLTRAIKFV